MTQAKHESFMRKIFTSGAWAIFTMIVWELVEEVLENLVAYALASGLTLFITKVLSTFVVIAVTQSLKVIIMRFLYPFIKKITFKEGFDKMEKLKKFFLAIWANKKTILGTASSAVIVASGSGLIDVNLLPAWEINGFNLTPLIYYVCLSVFTLIGIFGKGLEGIKTFFERIGLIKATKEEEKIKKEAEKEIVAEEKAKAIAESEAQKRADLLASESAEKEAKAKEEAEYRARVELAKQALLAEKNKTV